MKLHELRSKSRLSFVWRVGKANSKQLFDVEIVTASEWRVLAAWFIHCRQWQACNEIPRIVSRNWMPLASCYALIWIDSHKESWRCVLKGGTLSASRTSFISHSITWNVVPSLRKWHSTGSKRTLRWLQSRTRWPPNRFRRGKKKKLMTFYGIKFPRKENAGSYLLFCVTRGRLLGDRNKANPTGLK